MAGEYGRCQYIYPEGHDKVGEQCKMGAKANGFCGMARHGGRNKPGEAVMKAALASNSNARYAALVSGELAVQDLEWEEIKRGQLKNAAGNFSGMPHPVLPRQIALAMQKEFMRRAETEFQPDFDQAAAVMRDMMVNPRTPARERLAAAQYIMERAVGKIPEKQLLEIETRTYEAMLGDGPGSIFVDIPDSTGPASEATIKGEIAP